MGIRKRTKKLTKEEICWIHYDVGNSAFVMLSATLIPIYFSYLNDPGSSLMVAWGYAETIASLVIAIAMPFLGHIADIMGNKKKFFIGTVGTGVVACLLMGTTLNAIVFLAFYIIAAIALNSSMVFYDSFLVDASEPERRDKVSAFGYAWGYIGSCIPFVACVLIIFMGDKIGIDAALGMKIDFVITAIWWLVFSIPLIKFVRQKHGKPKGACINAAEILTSVRQTIRSIVNTKALFLFLIAYFFYIDGVHTIIKMAVSFGTELGLDSASMVFALLLTQIVAFPSSIAYGKLAGKLGSWRMIVISVVAYLGIVLYAAFFLNTTTQFWILAFAVGLFQGGIQALSRSYFANLIPPEKSNEMFGIFDIFGKYASAIGTFLVSTVTALTKSPSAGICSLVAMFFVALVLLAKMPKEER